MDRVCVPLDIVEHIVDWVDIEGRADNYLNRDDDDPANPRLASLKACALAGRQFYPFVRRKIFSKISFLNLPYDHEHRSRYIRSFNRLLDRTPDIASFVRSLDYGMRRSDFEDVEVQVLLRRLPMIRELHIRGISKLDRGLTWDAIPPDYLSILTAIFHLPSLTVLRVTKLLNFPFSLLASVSHIRILDISRVKFNDQEDYTAAMPHPRAHLLELHTLSSDINGFVTAMTKARPVFDITQLKSLYITVGFVAQEKGAINQIFEITRASVTHLFLSASPDSFNFLTS